MRSWAVLSGRELRLVDWLLAAGGIDETPTSARRDLYEDLPEEQRPDATWHRQLRDRVPDVEATIEQRGGRPTYGSLRELLAVREAPPGGRA